MNLCNHTVFALRKQTHLFYLFVHIRWGLKAVRTHLIAPIVDLTDVSSLPEDPSRAVRLESNKSKVPTGTPFRNEALR
jgi:hypothetical protein